MYVLGINVADGQSACLIGGDGRSVATAEHAGPRGQPGRLPARAIAACLDSLGVGPDAIDVVVRCGGGARDPGGEAPWPARARLHAIDDELAYACSAFYPSGFERAAVLVIGGAEGAARAAGYRATGGAPHRVFASELAGDGADERRATQLAMDAVHHAGVRKLCVAGDAAVHGLALLDPRDNLWLDQLYVPPAPGEAGTAVGAALFGWCELIGEPPPCELEGAFRGRRADDEEVVAAIASHGVAHLRRAGDPARVLDELAELLARGAVVAWFEGGAELGEALDRRCVLASAREIALAPRLGAALGRAAPRAPTAIVLVEDADDYFALTGPSPFGHRVAPVVRDRTREIPLVVRGDGTARVQTVDAWRSPRLHELISRYRRRTGGAVLAAVPLRELAGPAIERPRDALRRWDRAELDAIFLDGHLVVRTTGPVTDDES